MRIMKIRKPSPQERGLYRMAHDSKEVAPWCLLWECPKCFWARWQGLTLWKLIVVRDLSRLDVIVHEMTHVRQFKWLLVPYIKYFYYLWKYGYRNSPYEVEAYKAGNRVKGWLNGEGL